MRRSVYLALVMTTGFFIADWPATRASEDPHAYFNALIARPDLFKAYSLRPRAGASSTSPFWAQQIPAAASPWVTYNYVNDTDPQKQDAAKVRVPTWFPLRAEMSTVPSWTDPSLPQAINAAQTTFNINRGGQNFENGCSYLVDNEIMTQTSRTQDTVTVLRGQFGSTPAAHANGALVRRNSNSLPVGARFSTPTNGSISGTYLFTWDGYWTGSYVGSGLHNHKSLQISSWKDGTQWAETQTNFAGPPSITPNPAWNRATDVAAITERYYAQSTTAGASMDPGRPMANPPFILKPNKWTRFWVLIEANAETDSSKFSTVTTLAAPVTDINTTTIRINHNFSTNPFTADGVIADGAAAGRAIRIGAEIMTVVTGDSSGSTRNLTVVRGRQGTTPMTHQNGANVQVIDDYVTMYVADEDRNAVKLYDRVAWFLPIDVSDPVRAGSIGKFWIEFNTSTQQLPQGRVDAGSRDLVAYLRNLVVLLNPPREISPLLLRPFAGTPPIAPAAATNVRIIR